MTRRPDLFNQHSLEDCLQELGCPESSLSSTVSNYRLFVPLVLAELGEDRVLEMVCRARFELGLGEQRSAWQSAAKYIVAWANAALEDYKTRRGIVETRSQSDEPEQQPRLL